MNDCDQLRIVFAGTPEFALAPLQALADSGHSLVAVYTQPDRPAGRGRKPAVSAVKQRALELQLNCCQPESLREPAAQQALAALQADLMVVVAYGQILPPQVLSLPRLGCLNIHASLLPRWRGAAPIQRAILAGDSSSGVSLMQMEQGLDTGPVLSTHSLALGAETTAGELHDQLSALGARHLCATIAAWCKGEIEPQPQQHEQASYADKLSKAEALIDWQQPAQQIHRRIRAFNPWPVAETLWQQKKMRIWRASYAESTTTAGPVASPGTVLRCDHTALEVACGSGSLKIIELQMPGKKPVLASEFVNGNDLTGVLLGAEAS